MVPAPAQKAAQEAQLQDQEQKVVPVLGAEQVIMEIPDREIQMADLELMQLQNLISGHI